MGTFPSLAQASYFQEYRRAAQYHTEQGGEGAGSGELRVHKDTWLRANIQLIQMATVEF